MRVEVKHMRVQRIGTHTLPLPEYKTQGAAGFDLQASIQEPAEIQPGEALAIPCGFAFEIPEGFEGQVRGRSGLAFRFNVWGYVGTIDSDYRGEVCALLINYGDESFWVHPTDRVAQMVIAPVVQVNITESKSLDVSTRGNSGFGSTGI